MAEESDAALLPTHLAFINSLFTVNVCLIQLYTQQLWKVYFCTVAQLQHYLVESQPMECNLGTAKCIITASGHLHLVHKQTKKAIYLIHLLDTFSKLQ